MLQQSLRISTTYSITVTKAAHTTHATEHSSHNTLNSIQLMRLFSHDIAYHPSVQTSLSSSSLASTPILILKATFILNLCFILIIIFATNTILLSECALLPSEINEVDSFKESLLYAPITQLLPPPTRRPPTPSSSRPASVSLSHSHSPDQTHFKAKQCSQT